jgi:soluble lytic murein transglycosylase
VILPVLLLLLLLAPGPAPGLAKTPASGVAGASLEDLVFLLRTGRAQEALEALEGARGSACELGFVRASALELLDQDGEAAGLYSELVTCKDLPKEEVRLRYLLAVSPSTLPAPQRRKLPGDMARLARSLGGHPLLARLRIARAGALAANGDRREALRELERDFPAGEAPLALSLAARVAGEAGRDALAFAKNRRVFLEYPCSAEAQALEAEGGTVTGLSPQESFQRALALFRCKDYLGARALLEGLTAEVPGVSRDEVHWYLGQILAEKLRLDPEAALAHFQAITAGSPHADEAAFLQARCHLRLENYPAAEAGFREYAKRGRNKALKDKARYYVAWMPFDHGRWEEAPASLETYLDSGGGSMSVYVRWFRAWAFYKSGNWEATLAALTDLAKSGNPLVGGRGQYWTGVVLDRLGRRPEAVETLRGLLRRWPLSWYGLLAWKRLSVWNEREEPWVFLEDQAPAGGLKARLPRLSGRAGVAVQLASLGQTAFARSLLPRLGPAMAQGLEEAVGLSEFFEVPTVFREKVRRRGLYALPGHGGDLAAWVHEYPRAFWRLVEPEGRRRGLEPLFLDSIMRQESRYRRGVVSWADAMGLMQLIPPTAERLARQEGLTFRREQLFDEGRNLRLAAAYLDQLLDEFSGSYTLAALAYNSGAPAVKRFLGRKNQGMDEAVEDFAYNEGRNYCRAVTGHLLTYLYLYTTPEHRRGLLPALLPEDAPRVFPGKVDF